MERYDLIDRIGFGIGAILLFYLLVVTIVGGEPGSWAHLFQLLVISLLGKVVGIGIIGWILGVIISILLSGGGNRQIGEIGLAGIIFFAGMGIGEWYLFKIGKFGWFFADFFGKLTGGIIGIGFLLGGGWSLWIKTAPFLTSLSIGNPFGKNGKDSKGLKRKEKVPSLKGWFLKWIRNIISVEVKWEKEGVIKIGKKFFHWFIKRKRGEERINPNKERSEKREIKTVNGEDKTNGNSLSRPDIGLGIGIGNGAEKNRIGVEKGKSKQILEQIGNPSSNSVPKPEKGRTGEKDRFFKGEKSSEKVDAEKGEIGKRKRVNKNEKVDKNEKTGKKEKIDKRVKLANEGIESKKDNFSKKINNSSIESGRKIKNFKISKTSKIAGNLGTVGTNRVSKGMGIGGLEEISPEKLPEGRAQKGIVSSGDNLALSLLSSDASLSSEEQLKLLLGDGIFKIERGRRLLKVYFYWEGVLKRGSVQFKKLGGNFYRLTSLLIPHRVYKEKEKGVVELPLFEKGRRWDGTKLSKKLMATQFILGERWDGEPELFDFGNWRGLGVVTDYKVKTTVEGGGKILKNLLRQMVGSHSVDQLQIGIIDLEGELGVGEYPHLWQETASTTQTAIQLLSEIGKELRFRIEMERDGIKFTPLYLFLIGLERVEKREPHLTQFQLGQLFQQGGKVSIYPIILLHKNTSLFSKLLPLIPTRVEFSPPTCADFPFLFPMEGVICPSQLPIYF